jgi:hypothetical protein
VLPLQQDFTSSTLTKTKHSITRTIKNESSKTQVEIRNLSIGASRMELLCFLLDFHHSAATMHWTTGPMLFGKFPMHLQATDLDTWTLAAKPVVHTIVNFHQCIHSIGRTKNLNDSYDHQIEFLQSLQKPSKLDPSMFNALLLLHNLLLKELPGAPQAKAQFAYSSQNAPIFLHAMPIAWKDKFADASKTTHDLMMLKLQDYMR